MVDCGIWGCGEGRDCGGWGEAVMDGFATGGEVGWRMRIGISVFELISYSIFLRK